MMWIWLSWLPVGHRSPTKLLNKGLPYSVGAPHPDIGQWQRTARRAHPHPWWEVAHRWPHRCVRPCSLQGLPAAGLGKPGCGRMPWEEHHGNSGSLNSFAQDSRWTWMTWRLCKQKAEIMKQLEHSWKPMGTSWKNLWWHLEHPTENPTHKRNLYMLIPHLSTSLHPHTRHWGQTRRDPSKGPQGGSQDSQQHQPCQTRHGDRK